MAYNKLTLLGALSISGMGGATNRHESDMVDEKKIAHLADELNAGRYTIIPKELWPHLTGYSVDRTLINAQLERYGLYLDEKNYIEHYSFTQEVPGLLRTARLVWTDDQTQSASPVNEAQIKVIFWQDETSPREQILEGHTDTIESLAWNHDHSQLASGSRDATIKIWAWDQKKQHYILAQTLTGHTNTVVAVAWNDDSSRLASASRDKTIKIWVRDASTGTYHLAHTLTGHQHDTSAIAWHGKDLSTGDRSVTHQPVIKTWKHVELLLPEQLIEQLSALTNLLYRAAQPHEGAATRAGRTTPLISEQIAGMHESRPIQLKKKFEKFAADIRRQLEQKISAG